MVLIHHLDLFIVKQCISIQIFLGIFYIRKHSEITWIMCGERVKISILGLRNLWMFPFVNIKVLFYSEKTDQQLKTSKPDLVHLAQNSDDFLEQNAKCSNKHKKGRGSRYEPYNRSNGNFGHRKRSRNDRNKKNDSNRNKRSDRHKKWINNGNKAGKLKKLDGRSTYKVERAYNYWKKQTMEEFKLLSTPHAEMRKITYQEHVPHLRI